MRISDWSSDVCSSDLDRAPAHAVQRLEHRVAVLADEGLERGGIAADQGGGAALGELERGELLVEVAQAPRVVHHLRALALHEPQQQGVVDESGIDRRIPAHQHRSEEHTSELQSLMRISYAVFCLK